MARETPNIFAMSVAAMPFSRSFRALAASAASTLRGRPPLRPLAAAAASPARVRSALSGTGGGAPPQPASGSACGHNRGDRLCSSRMSRPGASAQARGGP